MSPLGDLTEDLTEDLLNMIFARVQRASFQHLVASGVVCKVWNRIVARRAVGIVRLEQPNTDNMSLAPVHTPPLYADLVWVWSELEDLYVTLGRMARCVERNVASEHNTTPSARLMSVITDLRPWTIDMATRILSKSTTWKLAVYHHRTLWRRRIYVQLCASLQLTPDPIMCDPQPPKTWSPERTCIIVDMIQNPHDIPGTTFEVYSPHHNTLRRVSMYEIRALQEVRCLDVWGSDRITWGPHDNVAYSAHVNTCARAALQQGTCVPPDCAHVACLYALLQETPWNDSARDVLFR